MFNHIKTTIVEGGSKLDDVIFVLHIAEHRALAERLPFLSVIAAHDDLLGIAIDEQKATTEARALQKVKAGLLALISSMQDRLLEGARPLQDIGAEELAILELSFVEKPEIDPGAYIELVTRNVTGPSTPLRMLGGRPGSWYEIIQTTVMTALAIYTTLFLVEGSLIKLLLIRARIAQLAAPKLPKKFLEQANDPRQVFPRELLKVVSTLYNAFSHSSLPLPNAKQGLTARKLREITIKPLDE